MAEKAHMPEYTLEELRGFERKFDQVYPKGVWGKFSLEDKVAIVTGSGQGNGRAIALCLAGAGADIVVADIRDDTGEATAEEIRALGRKALPIVTDVTKEDQIKAMVDKTVSEFGKIDVLVNNAAGSSGGRADALEQTEEQLNIGITGSFKPHFFATKAVAKAMIDRKIRGTIVNITTGHSLHPTPAGISGVGRAALNMYTQSMALYLSPYYIRVNAIAPGCIHTPVTRVGIGTDEIRVKERGMPLARIGQPEDVALAALYLASEASDWVTGIILEVHGGVPFGRMEMAEFESRRARRAAAAGPAPVVPWGK